MVSKASPYVRARKMRDFLVESYREGYLDVSSGTEVLEAFLALIWDDKEMVFEVVSMSSTWQGADEREAMLERLKNDPLY